jgi:hypothetical protein
VFSVSELPRRVKSGRSSCSGRGRVGGFAGARKPAGMRWLTQPLVVTAACGGEGHVGGASGLRANARRGSAARASAMRTNWQLDVFRMGFTMAAIAYPSTGQTRDTGRIAVAPMTGSEPAYLAWEARADAPV